MKKMNFALSALTACALFSSGVSAQNNHNFTVNFSGTVVETPCQVSGDENRTVDFGRIAKRDIGGVNSEKSFALQLVNCPLGTETVVALTTGNGSRVNNDPAEGMAKGVAIELYNDDVNGVAVIEQNETYTSRNGAIDVDLIAKVVPTVDLNAVEAGKISAAATFTLTYQ